MRSRVFVFLVVVLASSETLSIRESLSSTKRSTENDGVTNKGCTREGEVMLEGGDSNGEGEVKVCYDEKWFPICLFHQTTQWTQRHGEVACRSLNFSITNGFEACVEHNEVGEYGEYVTFECSGNEAKLTECSTTTLNFTCKIRGRVICQGPEDRCVEGEIRLADNNNTNTTETGRGRVEICSEIGVWGTVCNDEYWNDKDATVVCQSLGFNGTDHRAVNAEAEFGNFTDICNLVKLSHVECTGDEDNITSCPHGEEDADIACGSNEIAGVICDKPQEQHNGEEDECRICRKENIALVASFSTLGFLCLLLAAIAISLKIIYDRMRSKRRGTIEYIDHLSMIGRSSIKSTLESHIINRQKLEIGETLGEGCFGMVHKGVCHLDSGDTTVAIKTLKAEGNMRDFLAECVIMKDFNHNNILCLVGVAFEDETGLPLVILPFMANGDLRNFLHSKHLHPNTTISSFPSGLDLHMLLCMCRDIASGMEYLASNMFIHRDLAARNCMVDKDLTVKVADFGLSRDIYSMDYYRTHTKRLLPVKWMAPESLVKYIFTEKTDVWSYGVVCWEVFSLGSTPYPGVGNHEMSDYIAGGHRLKQPQLCPPDVFSLMERCWSADPDERPDFGHISRVIQLLVKGTTSENNSSPYYVNLPQNDVVFTVNNSTNGVTVE